MIYRAKIYIDAVNRVASASRMEMMLLGCGFWAPGDAPHPLRAQCWEDPRFPRGRSVCCAEITPSRAVSCGSWSVTVGLFGGRSPGSSWLSIAGSEPCPQPCPPRARRRPCECLPLVRGCFLPGMFLGSLDVSLLRFQKCLIAF